MCDKLTYETCEHIDNHCRVMREWIQYLPPWPCEPMKQLYEERKRSWELAMKLASKPLPSWEQLVVMIQRLESEREITDNIPGWLWCDLINELGGNPFDWLRTPISNPTCKEFPK